MSWHEILQMIKRDPRYNEGIMYGQPRKGHDEGSVRNHIAELEETLDKIAPLLTDDEYGKLLVLIHVHDTFKLLGKRISAYKEHVSLRDPRSHPMLAREFLAEFTKDEAVLAIAQWHDEGHALWKHWNSKGKINIRRLHEATEQIPDLELYLLFVVIDGWTVSKLKDRTPKWWVDMVYNHTSPPRPYRAYEALKLLEGAVKE